MNTSFELPVDLKRHAGLTHRLHRVLTTTSADWQRVVPISLSANAEPQDREIRRCSLLSRAATRAALKRRFN
jgi:hypothetical protein